VQLNLHGCDHSRLADYRGFNTQAEGSTKRREFSDEQELVIMSRSNSMMEAESNSANLSDNLNPPSSIAGTCPKGLMAAILHNQKFRSCYHLSN
jgi:hypothetical protein